MGWIKDKLKQVEKHVVRPVVHTVVKPIVKPILKPFERTKKEVRVVPRPMTLGEPDAKCEAHLFKDIPTDQVETVLTADKVIPTEVLAFVKDNITARRSVSTHAVVPNGTSAATWIQVNVDLNAQNEGSTVDIEYIVAKATVATSATNSVEVSSKSRSLGMTTHRGSSSSSQPRGLTPDEMMAIQQSLEQALAAAAAGGAAAPAAIA